MSETDPDPEFEQEQEDAAAAEAGAIGGQVSDEPSPDPDDPESDPAQRPLVEAGQGEAEGFELAERELVEHASHSDEHAAGRVIEDAFDVPDDPREAPAGEADELPHDDRDE